nr:metallophosphoesterase [Neobacillus sp. Marseille-Q6967]
MKKIITNRLMIVSIVFIILILYIIIDNNRIKIVKQEVIIDNLPEEIDRFTILQITDLHEKEFGKNQDRLIEKINSLSYDVIVFTGDMLKSSNSTNYPPFYKLIEGIKDKDNALFVPGNTDRYSYYLDSAVPYTKSDFIIGMERRGVMLLESIYTVEKGINKVYFTNFEFLIQNTKSLKTDISSSDNFINQQPLQYEISPSIDNANPDKDILIGLTHYPAVDARLDYLLEDSQYKVRDYDLILAGHYHGGQFRIPFLGAIFIPEGMYPRGGLLPPQDRVKGLWEYRGIKQYVSAGLGSSDAIPFLNFRVFNTPEINLITFRREK